VSPPDPRLLALLQNLHDEILGSRSATFTLEQWCRDHGVAEPVIVVARSPLLAASVPDSDRLSRLRVAEDSAVRRRRVQLLCGGLVLCEADNWYVPGRLTAEMNHLLETSDIPFGKVVRALAPHRQTFATARFWTAEHMGQSLFRVQALILGPDHIPLAEVDEVYQRPLLEFPKG
jgi:chorismate-pyruvate lyase